MLFRNYSKLSRLSGVDNSIIGCSSGANTVETMETMDKMDWFSPVSFVHTMDAISPMDRLDNPGPDKESIGNHPLK